MTGPMVLSDSVFLSGEPCEFSMIVQGRPPILAPAHGASLSMVVGEKVTPAASSRSSRLTKPDQSFDLFLRH